MHSSPDDAAILAIDRPHPSLLKYYLIVALAIPPAFPFLATYLYFRYHTMRYRFGAEGISMSWGILFHRQIIVNYARIQDIHLESNIVERWLGLARILVQTASGSSSAEMTIEGLGEFEAVRDFLYSRMRGVKDAHALPAAVFAEPANATPVGPDELAATLRDVATQLRAIRTALEKRAPSPEESRRV
ncbi:MAG TPA: PH domain-containing protein [Opitutus sp.]|nr:PH domain-containing protein [Opitutus sp.]